MIRITRWVASTGLLFFLLATLACPQTAARDDTATAASTLELVESFPAGTDFDQPDIPQAADVWLNMLKGAKHTIRWSTFYLSHEPGRATEPLVKELKTAAARGVKIELLVDEKFRKVYPKTLDELSKIDNIEVRTSPIDRWFGGVMHAKMLLVDDDDGFIGSQNFDWRSLSHIRELGIHFQDPELIKFYTTEFDWEWDHYKSTAPPADLPAVQPFSKTIGDTLVTPTASPSELNKVAALSDETQLLRLLNGAQHTVEVAVLSYSPVTYDGKRFYATLDNALRSAAVRGVKIRMIVGEWEERSKTVDHLLSLGALHNVEVRACRIPPAPEGPIDFARVHHSKYLVVDGKSAWIGTSNWEHGYFHESRNFGMVLQGGPLPARLGRLFDFDWARSTAVQEKDE